MDDTQNQPSPPDAPREPQTYDDGSADEQASPSPPLDSEDEPIPGSEEDS